nr:prolipoprotein diacylglyceryl transferase family protein [uncultured Agathobaculum sp.]
MLPYLSFFGRTTPTYGLLMALAGLLGWRLCVMRARNAAWPQEAASRLYVLFLVGALVGAKVYSLALVFPQLSRDLPLLWQDPTLFAQRYLYGGMVFYGGLIGGLICVAWALLRHKISFALLEQIYLPVVPLAHAIGRVGCFFAGCCYGMPTDSLLGVVYPPGGLAPAGVRLYPVQLFEAAGDLVLWALLWWGGFRRTGSRLVFYLAGYGMLRFVTECFRGDPSRGLAGPLSGAQWISLICIAAAFGLLLARRFRKGAKA